MAMWSRAARHSSTVSTLTMTLSFIGTSCDSCAYFNYVIKEKKTATSAGGIKLYNTYDDCAHGCVYVFCRRLVVNHVTQVQLVPNLMKPYALTYLRLQMVQMNGRFIAQNWPKGIKSNTHIRMKVPIRRFTRRLTISTRS
jgi:hypothetical protein